ncbi:MAG TPA: CocE/NonD family hydrolase [Solirubrobacterales bacterium]|nr:CocE/NonD family hydrolase [Solirubrobacterales bacterium]
MKRSGIGLAVRIGIASAALAIGLAAAPSAGAAIPNVYGGAVSCAPQPANGNVRLCSGPTTSWDGTKVDVNVILPPEPGVFDGPYPVIGNFHGWGGSKIGLDGQTQAWAEDGYAVFSMSDRGWGNSCGGADPEKLLPACAAGYNHLMDSRYEVRDAQHLIGVLADEGVAQPQRIGATGMSYGGGISMALAALRDRTMLPDGSLAPWKSPGGKAMSLAVAVPRWPWSDLAYSLMPNGRTLDYVADAPYRGPDGKAPIGIEKASYVSALYGTGQALSNYALPGTDPDADLVTWFALINAGEPYDTNPLVPSIVEEITTHHSSYYIDHSQPPAPLLIQSGWNDDLFPVDEAIRFYNRTRTQYPGDPISLFLMDDGHARSQNKLADGALFTARRDAWFDHYLKGEGGKPVGGATALTTKCGGDSEGPYEAASWRELAPGEIRLNGAAAQTIAPGGGDPALGTAFDPFAGGGGPCGTGPAADQPGAATYRLSPTPAEGFTLLGSPTVVADIDAPGGQSALAARLLDVSPGGTEALVARGLLRPGNGGNRFVFQLHPQAYRFAPGSVAKLELLGTDTPYARPSNAQAPITVSNLQLRLPVREKPGSLGGLVQEPAPKILPPGYQLAAGYSSGGGGSSAAPRAATGRTTLARGRIAATRKALLVRVRCGAGACSGRLTASVRKRAGVRRTIAAGAYSLPANRRPWLRVPLTKAGRKLVAAKIRRAPRAPRAKRAKRLGFRARIVLADSGQTQQLQQSRRVRVAASKP